MPAARYFPRMESTQRSPGLRARTLGSSTRKISRTSGAQILVPFFLLPGLRPWVRGKKGHGRRISAPGFPNWESCPNSCAPVGPDAPIGPLRRDTTCRVRFRRATISLPRAHAVRPYASGWNRRAAFPALHHPDWKSQALSFGGWRFQCSFIQGRRPGRRRSGTRFCAPDGTCNITVGRPPYQGVWGMGKENTRRSRGVFTRSPSPSDFLVPLHRCKRNSPRRAKPSHTHKLKSI